MLKYDGGGHKAAGGCQVDNDKQKLFTRMKLKINQDG